MITGGGPVGMLFVHTLGTARIDAGNARLTPTSVRKFALLLHLSAEPGRRVPRDVLRELIFPDSTEDNARHSLRELLYGFRRLGVRIDSDKHGMALASDAVASDYSELLAGDRPDPAKLAAAAGGFLPGYAPEHSEAYAEWLAGYRARATFEICKALLKELTRAKRVGDWAQAERAARACLALDPLNEEATLGLAEMLAIGGAKVAAVRLLDEYVKEVGRESGDLTVSAKILRRRISEQEVEQYAAEPDFPFVGRTCEMSLLTGEFERSKAGAARATIISGVPGIGKSRLAREFAQIAALAGARVERVVARENRVRQPLAAFIEIVPRLLGLRGALGCSASALQHLRLLTGRSDTAEIAVSEPSLAITRAVQDLFEAVCDEQQVVLVVEDAHWLDAGSRELLFDIIAAPNELRLFAIVTSRDSAHVLGAPAHSDNLAHLALPPLPNDALEQLAEQSASEAEPEVRRWMLQTAAGNPLFLSNLIAHYRTTGERLTMPPTLSELLRQRVTRLPLRALNVLRMCVVLAPHCTPELLRAALQFSDIDLLENISELERHDILRSADNSFVTVHPLIDEVVLAGCSTPVLSMLHRRAAEVLEGSGRDTSASVLWVCAEHWLAAGARKESIAALSRCAQYAGRIGRTREAAVVRERIFELAEDDAERITAGREIVMAYTATSELAKAAAWAEVVRSLSPEIRHDDYELSELRSYVLGGFDVERSEPRLLACVESDADNRHRVDAGTMISIVADLYDRREALARARASLKDVVAQLPPNDELRFRFELISSAAIGDIEAATVAAQSALSLADTLEPFARTRCQFNASIVLWRASRIDDAVESLQAAFRNAMRFEMVGTAISLTGALGGLLYSARRYEVARKWIAVGAKIWAEHPRVEARWDFLSMRAYIAAQDNDLELATQSFNSMPTLPERPLSRLRRWYDAFGILLQTLGGAVPTNEEIEELISRSTRDNGSGIEADLEIETAWRALCARGNAKAGVEVLREHIIRAERKKTPFNHGLQIIAAQVGLEITSEKRALLKSLVPTDPDDICRELELSAAAIRRA